VAMVVPDCHHQFQVQLFIMLAVAVVALMPQEELPELAVKAEAVPARVLEEWPIPVVAAVLVVVLVILAVQASS